MSQEHKDFIGVIFDSPDGAREALESMKDLQHGAYVHIEDTAVIYKDADGDVHVDNEVSRGAKMATGLSGGTGLLVGVLLGGPIGGLAVGLLGGALITHFGNMGIDPQFVDDVKKDLKPGTSALFLLSREDSRDMVIAGLAPFEGTIYQTSLPPESVAQLKEYLDE